MKKINLQFCLHPPPAYLQLVLAPDYFTRYFIAGTFPCSKFLSWVMGGQPPQPWPFLAARHAMLCSFKWSPDWMWLLCIPAAWIILQQINRNPIWAEIRNQPSMREGLHSTQPKLQRSFLTQFHFAFKIDNIWGCIVHSAYCRERFFVCFQELRKYMTV